ncbi:hypothetical protein CTI12_AA401470 [Artemisia annua]|uniref:Uncharacterized protein n=1 Tax=Artemisia annua TaxID=35608 RepID=A0A2U1MAH4_ARTAN|nr:hypothetical protein CTI12_AA401470 [Artemisia annua]
MNFAMLYAHNLSSMFIVFTNTKIPFNITVKNYWQWRSRVPLNSGSPDAKVVRDTELIKRSSPILRHSNCCPVMFLKPSCFSTNTLSMPFRRTTGVVAKRQIPAPIITTSSSSIAATVYKPLPTYIYYDFSV